jgi:hypothetical protein
MKCRSWFIAAVLVLSLASAGAIVSTGARDLSDPGPLDGSALALGLRR